MPTDTTPADRIVTRWQQAWQALDADAVAALYAPDGTHQSAVVSRRMPDVPDGVLRGPEMIRSYARLAAAAMTAFRIDILDVFAKEDRAAVEYWRIINNDDASRLRVVEILVWNAAGQLTEVRVFHA